ncbi:MAG: hypothetical protein HY017_12495 [Betaproteobacteria bacterium]|nr:hypothetical protein [Betaproteobacteria bacterium]
MKPEEHRAKAGRIERSLAKCGPADYEMKIEAAMLAGTHWLNLALHRRGVTPPQTDILHTYMLTVNELRKYRVADERLVDALSEIEDIRPGYVRGNLPGGEKAAERALELLAQLRRGAGG